MSISANNCLSLNQDRLKGREGGLTVHVELIMSKFVSVTLSGPT